MSFVSPMPSREFLWDVFQRYFKTYLFINSFNIEI